MVAYGSRSTEGRFGERSENICFLQGHADVLLARHEVLLRTEGTRNEAQSIVFYFAHGFLGQYIPYSVSEICADDAEASFLGLNPGSSTFRDKTPTFTWQKGKFASFYRNYCVFCVLDGYSHLMILL